MQTYLTEHIEFRKRERQVAEYLQRANAWTRLLDACTKRQRDIIEAIQLASEERMRLDPEAFLTEEDLEALDDPSV